MCVARTFAETPDQSDFSLQSVTKQRDGHAVAAPEVAAALGVEPTRGLATAEVDQRGERYGPNSPQKIQPRPPGAC